MHWPDEAELVARLRRRDERAFRTFVRALEGPVFNLIYRMIGNAAEAQDVSQDVFVSVFGAIDRFRGDCKLSTWVFRIAINHTRNRAKYLARRNVKRTAPYHEVVERTEHRAIGEAPPRPDEQVMAQHAQEALTQALLALEPEQRELVVLRDLQGLSYEDIQEVTGLVAGTVKSRLHRARLALQQSMAEYLNP